jgi:hypothetical protein
MIITLQNLWTSIIKASLRFAIPWQTIIPQLMEVSEGNETTLINVIYEGIFEMDGAA